MDINNIHRNKQNMMNTYSICTENEAFDNNIMELNFQPPASILNVFSRLSYKPWYAIAEFVDNSTQSYISHIDELSALSEFEKLIVNTFRQIIKNRPRPKVEPIIDGCTGFLYLDKNGMPLVAQHWEKHFQLALRKYNSIYKVQLPKITPHVCRHTYCSNMAKSGMNPKTLQYLMGHSEIGVTLDTYTHIGEEDARSELERLGFMGKNDRALPCETVKMSG